VGHHGVDRPHPVGVGGGVRVAEEEDLPGQLLADLAGEVGGSVSPVEAGHVGVGLLEPGVLGAGEGQVGDDVQTVPSPGRPPGHDGDDDLRHEADQALHLEDVQPPGAGRVGGGGVIALRIPVTVTTPDALVPSRAKGPPPVARRGTVAGEQDASDVGGLTGMVEHPVELIDGVGAEGVADLGPVECDPHRPVVDGPVVGDVGQLGSRDRAPGLGVEELGHEWGVGHMGRHYVDSGIPHRAAPPPIPDVVGAAVRLT
jgi:hypothetical protein